MLVNRDTAVSTSGILLVPYEPHHVPTYHSWMKNEELQHLTASDPLSLEEEYAMQQSWRRDADKLTFIVCIPISSTTLESDSSYITSKVHDPPSRILGDINLFLTPADEGPEGCIGEIELMIAPVSARRKGFGCSALLTFLNYLERNLDGILVEYGDADSHSYAPKVVKENKETDENGEMEKGGRPRPNLLQLRVKIGSKNRNSIDLFQTVGFVRVGEENYFGEVELALDGVLRKERIEALLKDRHIEDYKEVDYVRGE